MGLARKCGTPARACSFATARTLVPERSEARDSRATDETGMKHGSESKEVIGGPAGEAHAGTSRSPHDHSISWLWKLSFFLIRVPSVFLPWLKNLRLCSLAKAPGFPLELPVGADAPPAEQGCGGSSRETRGAPGQLAGDEFPQNCERATVRNWRKKGEKVRRRDAAHGTTAVNIFENQQNLLWANDLK